MEKDNKTASLIQRLASAVFKHCCSDGTCALVTEAQDWENTQEAKAEAEVGSGAKRGATSGPRMVDGVCLDALDGNRYQLTNGGWRLVTPMLPNPQPTPRFKVGDRVHAAEWATGISAPIVDVAPGRSTQYRLLGEQKWRVDAELTPTPVVCSPDGTRCAEWRRYIDPARMYIPETGTQVNQDAFRGCPYCLGKLREG